MSFKQPLARKVPQVGLLFWVIKLLTTAMGESTSDYLVNSYNPYVVVILGFVALVAALYLQFSTRKYNAWIYWLTVLMVAIFGTMAADVAHVALGIPYIISSVCFAIVLVIVFTFWKRSEGTLSIHSITTTQREVFYWLTVLSTFALGTAAGDLAAYGLKLGFFKAGLVFAAIFVIPAIGWKLFSWSSVFSFWFAYIMTRPLGASFADWTGKAKATGALGWGDGPVATAIGLSIVILVAYLALSHEDVDHSRN